MRVLTAEIYHETNTFSCRKTDIQSFKDGVLLMNTEAITARGDANTELAGFLDAGKIHGWQIDHILTASAGPGGLVTRSAFDSLVLSLIAAAKNNHYDGILLGMHGAMVTEFCDDGEGEILKRLRAAIGPDVPIAITLDLHANVSIEMCSLANVIVSYKTYPHIDMREVGIHAADILQRTMADEIRPRTIRVSRPMLEEINGGRTDIGPMIDRFAEARNYETGDDVFAVSINAGFASADIAEVGPTVLVTAQGDFLAHTTFAETIAEDIWARRKEVLNTYHSVEAAANIAAQFDAGNGPLIIADYADNPGAGGYGDSTNLLRALLDANISNVCFGPMVDPDAVQQLQKEKIGDQITVSLGGKTNPDFGGAPLSLDAELIATSNGDYIGNGPMICGLHGSFGPTVVIRVDGIEILVVSIARQMLDLQQFESFGIEPQNKNIVALKSMQHFRAAFEPIAVEVIVCDSGALCTPDYDRLPYRNVPRPIFPLDDQ